MSGLQIIGSLGPQVTQTLFWITVVECYFSFWMTVSCKLHFLSCIDIFMNVFSISENIC